jgi:hypothetical protein
MDCNNGYCNDGTCICDEGWMGTKCDIREDPCKDIICLNNGTCVNGKCDCPMGFTGSDCGIKLIPKSLRITKFVITKFPATKPNGDRWDSNSNADLYMVFSRLASNGNLIKLTTSGIVLNADPNKNHEFIAPSNLIISDIYTEHAIELYDDDPNQDDFMVGGKFTLYQNTQSSFPSKLSFSGSNISFEVYLTYYF